MAAAFTRLGTSVTIVDIADRVLPGGQPAASQAVARAYAAAGIDVRLNARVSSFDERTRTLAFATEAGAETVADVDAVLVATGRVANVEALQLDVAGLTADRDGIAVDSWGRTSVPGIWAVGDVTRGSHQTHAANALGRRIVRRLAFRWLPAFVRPQVIPSAVFSDPEVAWVGPTPTELRRRYHPDLLRHVRVELADTDRGLTDGVGGFVEITATRLTGRIVAATCVGPSASELIGMLTLAMSRRVSMYKLSRLVFAYPTFAAAIGKAADEFAFATIGGMRAELFAYAKHRFARPAWKIPV